MTCLIPESPSQTRCREWWTAAQPYIHRCWARDRNGIFFAEESRLLHDAWLHAFTLGSSTLPPDLSYRAIYQCERGPDDDEVSTPDDPRTLSGEG